MVTSENEDYEFESDTEENEVFEYSDLTQDERAGILTWYFTNRKINGKHYEWLIDSPVTNEHINKMASIALIEFMEEWNNELKMIRNINYEEPELQVRLYMVFFKSSNFSYRLNIEYLEGGITTILKTLELYTSSKVLNDVLDIYTTTSVFTRNDDYIWKF